jgi:exonuclease III
MKILTWNLGYWQHSSYHDEAWAYLCNQLKPDLAFLQEVKPPSWVPCKSFLFEEITRGWGTAIYAPSLALSKKTFSLYPGRVVTASVTLNNGLSLFIASIHAPIIDGRVFLHLANIFAELELMHDSQSAVVGGDLNSARLAEKVWPGHGHGPFFERIDKGDYWIDCCRRFHPTEIQTFFRSSCLHAFQDDHIFASCDLGHHIRACDVLKNELTRRVSDHIPLIAELDLSFNTTLTMLHFDLSQSCLIQGVE